MNVAALVGAIALVASTCTSAQTRGVTTAGRAWVNGGRSAEEFRAMARERDQYRLWLTISGPILRRWPDDIDLRLQDASGASLLVVRASAPWLFVDLPPGRYMVEARRGDRIVQRADVQVRAGPPLHLTWPMQADAEVADDAPPAEAREPAEASP